MEVDKLEKKQYLVVDPGLRNTAICLIEVTGERAEVVLARVGDLSGQTNPFPDSARLFFKGFELSAKEFLINDVTVIIEFQPPLNTLKNPALVRWNSWIEGFAIGYFQAVDWPVTGVTFRYAHSNSVKAYFNIRGGSHSRNKRLALDKARTFLADPKSVKTDHEADCVLMALYVHSHFFTYLTT